MKLSAFFLSLPLVLVLSATGCKTTRKAQAGGTKPGKNADESAVRTAYEKGRLQFHYMSLKGKGKYTGPSEKDQFDFTYKITIAKDSLIQCSLQKFGVEGMRIHATRDSVLLKRIDTQEVIRCDYTLVQKATGLQADYFALQHFLLGEMTEELIPLNFVQTSSPPWQFAGASGAYKMNWFLDGMTHKVVKLEASDAENTSTCGWSDFREVGGVLFAHLLALDIKGPRTLQVNLQHSALTVDEGNFKFDFSYPDHYAVKNCSAK